MTSASFPKFFLHRCVINLGTTKTWNSVGFTIRSSLNNSITVSIAAGGGLHNLGPLMSGRLNQSSGVSNLSGEPFQAIRFREFDCHHKLTQVWTRWFDLPTASSFKGMWPSGSSPFITPSKKSPLDRPLIPALFIRVPAICIM